MGVFLSRLGRIFAKAKLRLAVARRVLFKFEDTISRSQFKLSFAQSGEDLIVWFLFDQMDIRRPTYLDIGAHHPELLSNTALFYLLGSRGINIEPNPSLFLEFAKRRPKDVNLNLGLAETPGSMTFYRMHDPSLSTFSQVEAERIQFEEGIKIKDTLKIQVENINSILESYNFCPDFVSIDTEGMDLVILKSLDFRKCRPLVICVETVSFSTTRGQGKKNAEILQFLALQGYGVYSDTYINTIFVDKSKFYTHQR